MHTVANIGVYRTRRSGTVPALLCALFLAGTAAKSEAARSEVEADPPKRVLILYDENNDFAGLALMDQSIKATLKAGMPVGLEVYTEYLDVSRFHEPGRDTMLGEF